MQFSKPLIEGTLIRRYKRFLAKVALLDGNVVTAHTSNTGSMKGCTQPGSRVWLSVSDNPKRKYPLTWEIVEAKPGILVNINTIRTNTLVHEGISQGIITELSSYSNINSEVPYGKENSRIDLFLKAGPDGYCYVEVKNVTLVDDGTAMFPDAVTSRGTRHLRELTDTVKRGYRAAIFFCVAREDAFLVRPADEIDPNYGQTLRQAMRSGVESIAYSARVTPSNLVLSRSIPVVTD